MVIGFNSDGQDGFGIVLLAPLGAGQTITATDDGWRTDVLPNTFRGYEDHVAHTAASEEPTGTVLTKADFVGPPLILSYTADQVIVY